VDDLRRVNLGAGWVLKHITDRTVYLVKEDVVYRSLTGRDGYVLVRGEPGATREQMLEHAQREAEETDAKLGLMLGERLLPANFKIKERAKKYKDGDLLVSTPGAKVVSVSRHREIQAMLRHAFATPEDPQRKIYRP
jgi:hypothetical protein